MLAIAIASIDPETLAMDKLGQIHERESHGRLL